MANEVIRHIHKYAKAMYVMVSVPENKEENIYESPIILGCFKTKDDAKAAWKARTPAFKSIKAKTVHVYRKYLKSCFSVALTQLRNTMKRYILILYPTTDTRT